MKTTLQLLAVLAVLATVTSCKTRTIKVVTPTEPSAVDPDVQECTEADVVSFFEEHSADLDECTQHFGCKKTGIRTVTFMVGCTGVMGSLAVLSHEDLGGYNECLVERSSQWDFAPICKGVETDCTWTMTLEVECRVE